MLWINRLSWCKLVGMVGGHSSRTDTSATTVRYVSYSPLPVRLAMTCIDINCCILVVKLLPMVMDLGFWGETLSIRGYRWNEVCDTIWNNRFRILDGKYSSSRYFFGLSISGHTHLYLLEISCATAINWKKFRCRCLCWILITNVGNIRSHYITSRSSWAWNHSLLLLIFVQIWMIW